MVEKIERELQLDKLTKNKAVYTDGDPAAAVSSLYIARSALPKGIPGEITLTLHWEGE